MTRTAALESATCLAAASGLHYRVYRDHARRDWQVVDGILMSDEAHYTIHADGRIIYHMNLRDRGTRIRDAR
jgi:hypothetical protein